MELDSRKKDRRDGMMRSKSFNTQEVIGIGQKEAGKPIDFPILWIELKENVQERKRKMEGKECKVQERLKMCKRKSMPERGRCFSIG